MFIWLTISLFLKVAFVSTRAQPSLEDVYNLLSRIDETLRKEDRMREITQIVRIDATLKSIDKRIGDIAHMMEDDNLGRAVSSDLRSDLRTIGDRIEKMEDATQSLKEMMSKMDTELDRLEQVEHKTNQLERDLEHRLTKLMNAISSLHEINKGLSNHIRSGNRGEDSNSLSSDSVTYLTDALEDVERKVKEQLSILEVQLKKELDNLRIMTSNALVQCETWGEENEGGNVGLKEGRMSTEQIDVLTNNLSAMQREMKEELHQGIRSLEKQIEGLSSTSANCVAETRTAEAYVPDKPKPECEAQEFDSTMRSCAELRKAGNTCNGPYVVLHLSGQRLIKVYCDMKTDGGGWTVFMRRGDFGKPQSFNLPWGRYKEGFGDPNKEFWLGNDAIHVLTSGNETQELRIELESFDNGSRTFTYGSFAIDDENNEYRMKIGGPVGGRSVHFLRYRGRPFVTYDRITDQPGDCASKYKGGWWYRKNCIYTVLTAERFTDGTRTSMLGMQSELWREAGVLKGVELKFRPRDFRV